MNKIIKNAETALQKLEDGAKIMFSGFGLSGNPENCIAAVAASGKKNITVISNNCGNQGQGLAILLQQKQVGKVICSFVGGNPDLEEQMLNKSVEVELNPQGTLAERIRAGGAGIGAFYTPTGAGTLIAKGKDERFFDGKKMILETGLKADYACVRAYQADAYGNCRFYGTSRNFGPAMAMAGKYTIIEADQIVPIGSIPAADVHLPGVFVQAVFQGQAHKNIIEHRMTRKKS